MTLAQKLVVSHYAFTCHSINTRELSLLFRSQNTAEDGEVYNKSNTTPAAAVAGRHSPAKVQPSIWPVEVTPGQVPSTSHLQVEHVLDYRRIRTESFTLNSCIFNCIFLASVMEEWRRTAMASMNPPSTPSWTTSARTATTSTRSQMYTSFVGKT